MYIGVRAVHAGKKLIDHCECDDSNLLAELQLGKCPIADVRHAELLGIL